MKSAFSIFFLLLFATSVCSQEYGVTGCVVDAGNKNEALPLAQLRLFAPDSTLVASAVSDDDGSFYIKTKKEGKYSLLVTFMGYKNLVKNILISSKKPVAKLGRLSLVPDSKLLREAQVTGLANELTIKADTFVYHSNAFRVPAGASVAALIQQLPGLTMDDEGNLTFQGKKVSNILINGKPFFGDSNTAMANMTSEAVQDVQVYEKSDENKEFTGVADDDKQTVVDLKIKKEYMKAWNINADVAGGTHDRFIGKIFASTFDDNYKAAVYAQANNISQNQRVDENGNWQYWGGANGFYTYRTTGGIFSYDNGKNNKDAGYFRFNGDVRVGRNNSDIRSMDNSETFLGNAGRHYSYGRTTKNNSYLNVDVNIGVVWNIDTLNRITFGFDYSLNKRRGTDRSNISVYNSNVDIEQPYMGLTDDKNIEELRALGVNSTRGLYAVNNSGQTAFLYTHYTRRLPSINAAIVAGLTLHRYDYDAEINTLSQYRYFNATTVPDNKIDRQYRKNPNNYRQGAGGVTLEGTVGKYISYNMNYEFTYRTDNSEQFIYRLDQYDEYAVMGLPLGVHPSTFDSIFAVRDVNNSNIQKTTTQEHQIRASLTLKYKNLDAVIRLKETFSHDELEFKQNGKIFSPSQNVWLFNPLTRLKWKPIKNAELNISYYGYKTQPELTNRIPLSDTSDEMTTKKSNPNLKSRWMDSFNFNGNYFGDKRGDNYSFYMSYSAHKNDIVTMMQTDPQTGHSLLTEGNVNGNYSYSFYVSTQQPLDTARRWTLSVAASYARRRSKNYVGAVGDEMGLSVVNTYKPYTALSLKWRKNMWSVSLRGAYTGEHARYRNSPQYNQNGHIYECSLQPQVDLPCGLNIHSDFGLYKRKGYDDALLNHSQWLWNVTVSQSFLKDKSLSLMLEAVDILRQRTSEYSVLYPDKRSFGRVDTFMSYFMLHAVYRLNIGGKK